jgi:hypothetical protein
MSKRFDVYERKENKFTKNSQKKFKLAMNPDVKKKMPLDFKFYG